MSCIMNRASAQAIFRRTNGLRTTTPTSARFFSTRSLHRSRVPWLGRSGPITRRFLEQRPRHISSDSQQPGLTASSPSATPIHPREPAYDMHFTCKPCSHRSGPHRITKHGYHKGTTLITCPSCRQRHVISDHLRIFTTEGGTLEEIMSRHGEKLKKGRLGIRPGKMVGNEGEEEIEFWDDGTETVHTRPDYEPKVAQQ